MEINTVVGMAAGANSKLAEMSNQIDGLAMVFQGLEPFNTVASLTIEAADSNFKTIYDLNQPVYVDSLEWSTMKTTISYFRMQPYLEDGSVVVCWPRSITNNGTSTTGGQEWRMSDILNLGHPFWTIEQYDTDLSQFKVALKNLYFPYGLKIQVRNNSASQQITTGIQVTGRS